MQHQFRYRSPCRGCKKRRRACFREGNSAACFRCSRLKLECVPFTHDPDDDDDVLPKEYGSKALEYWHHQVEQLENELQHTEYTIQQCTNAKPSPQEVEWKLSIENGLLKVHTMITTLEELVMYSRASLRYLSPFKGLFNGTPIRFENSAVINVLRGFRTMIKGAITPPESYPPMHQTQWVSENEPYRPIVDELVHWYLEQKNPQRPLLHAASFLEHYRNLSDPLSCPVTLAICCNTVCHTNQLKGCSASQRRQMAEFFYSKAKDILLEIFDDPKRKLETLYTITFLQHYIIYILLQPLEARRFATIAILICEDLQLSFEKENSYTLVERTIFERHHLQTKGILNLLAFIIDHDVKKTLSLPPFLQALPDEDDRTSDFLDTHNHLFRLSKHPCIRALMDEIQKLVSGKSDELSVEWIFRLDETIREWWQDLPSHLRLCDDLFSTDAAAAIKQKPSMAKSVIFAFTHSILVRIHACMITPKPRSDSDTGPEPSAQVTEETLLMLSARSRSILLRSCDYLLDIMLYMLTGQEELGPMTFKFVFRLIHALLSLASSSRNEIPVTIQEKFYEYMSTLYSRFPSDVQIPTGASPLHTFLATHELGNFAVYRDYPLPGYALICDILRSTHAHVQFWLENGPDKQHICSARAV